MLAYFDRRYVGANITVVAAGNFDWHQLVKLVKDRCDGWPKGAAPRTVQPAAGDAAVKLITKGKVAQEHMFLVSAGPPADSPLRYAAEIIANAIGDDSGSRLYWALIDPGLAESADTSFHEYEGAGAFYTYLGGDPKNAAENLAIAKQVLEEVQREGLSGEEIRTAKSKLGARIVRGSERPMGRMQAIGYYWTYLKEYRTMDQDLEAIDAVSAESVREVLNRYPLTRFTTLALGPLEELKPVANNGNSDH
jgi:predicted Zn-dependent peptidase